MRLLARLLKPHPGWLVPAGLWMAVIWFLSARPASAYRKVGPVEAKRLPVVQIAIAAHFLSYGTLGAMLHLGIPVHRGRLRSVVAWSVAVLYGITDELHQAQVSGRDASPSDVVTDAVGAATGIATIAGALDQLERKGPD